MEHGSTGVLRWVVGAAVLVLLGIATAAVALAYAGWMIESIAGLLTAIGTVGAALLVALGKLLGDLNSKVDQVVHQTNGAMRETIAEVVSAELDARGITRPSEPATRTVTPPKRGRPTR